MEFKYFIFYKRVYCGKTVSQGNMGIALDKPITMEDIRKIENKLKADAKEYSDSHIKMSESLVVNFIKF